MRTSRLRATVGLGLVVAHFGILGCIAVFTGMDRFTQEEMFLAFGIIAPLFAAYTTVIVRQIMGEPPVNDEEKRVSGQQVFLSLGIPAFFVASVAAGVVWKAFGSLDFDGLVKLMGAAETLLGAYVGIVVERFFKPA